MSEDERFDGLLLSVAQQVSDCEARGVHAAVQLRMASRRHWRRRSRALPFSLACSTKALTRCWRRCLASCDARPTFSAVQAAPVRSTACGFHARTHTAPLTRDASAGARDAVLRAYEKQARLAANDARASTSSGASSSVAAAPPSEPKSESPADVLAREQAELAKRTAPREVEVKDASDDVDVDADADADDKPADGESNDDGEKATAKDKGQDPNVGNGGSGPGYVWTQVLAEVEVRIPVESGTRGKALDVQIGKRRLVSQDLWFFFLF